MIYIMSYPTNKYGDSLFDIEQLQYFYSNFESILKQSSSSLIMLPDKIQIKCYDDNLQNKIEYKSIYEGEINGKTL